MKSLTLLSIILTSALTFAQDFIVCEGESPLAHTGNKERSFVINVGKPLTESKFNLICGGLSTSLITVREYPQSNPSDDQLYSSLAYQGEDQSSHYVLSVDHIEGNCHNKIVANAEIIIPEVDQDDIEFPGVLNVHGEESALTCHRR